MKTLLIAGSIVDTASDKFAPEDVCVEDVKSFLDGLEAGEEVQLEITSYGGSVPAGIAICNLLKQASANGHKTTSHVIGIAASMASAIACACDVMKMDSNAFFMIHNPWTFVQGDAEDMRKEADVLDKFRDALLAIYRSKFVATDEVLKKMMDDETWFLGSEAEAFMLKCEVIPSEEPLKAAAFAKDMPKFLNIPQSLVEIIMKKKDELKTQADATQEANVEERADETVAETTVEEPVVEDEVAVEEPTPETPEEMVTKAEADKRVSGMQSAMAKQMDALKKDYEAKIADFEVQMKAKDEELTSAKAEVTSLSESLQKTSEELSKVTSALKEKADALDALNASVNTPSEKKTDWKSLKGQAFFDWYAKTH